MFPNAAGWINSAKKIIKKPICQHTKKSNTLPYVNLSYLQHTYLLNIKYVPGTILFLLGIISKTIKFSCFHRTYIPLYMETGNTQFPGCQFDFPLIPLVTQLLTDVQSMHQLFFSFANSLSHIAWFIISTSMPDVVWIKRLARKTIWRLLQ